MMYKSANFRPNQKGYIKSVVGYDVKGRPEFSERTKVRLSFVRIETDIAATSIRADKSGSKSRAQEQNKVGRVLIEAKASFEVGDLLELFGDQWKIDSKFLRMDQAGRLHHFQADIVSWV